MAELNFVGDTVDLAYEVNVDEIAPLKIVSITVSVFSEEGEIIHEDPCTILNGVVEYTVDSSMTTHRGDYMAVFNLEFTGGIKKTYKMPFVVLPRGIAKEGIGTHVSSLTEDSTEDEVEGAIDADIRNIRREKLGAIEGHMLILDIAQYKTGRRHKRW